MKLFIQDSQTEKFVVVTDEVTREILEGRQQLKLRCPAGSTIALTVLADVDKDTVFVCPTEAIEVDLNHHHSNMKGSFLKSLLEHREQKAQVEKSHPPSD